MVVRCHGNTDPAEGIAHDQVPAVIGDLPDAGAAVLDADLQVRSRPQAEAFDVDLHDARVDLRDHAAVAGPGRGEVAREGHPSATDVIGGQRLPRLEAGVDDSGERLDVGELQVGGVVQVDVGVQQPVEHQEPALAACTAGITVHLGTVILRLGVAAAGREGGGDRAEQEQDQRDHRRPTAYADLDGHRCEQKHEARGRP